MSGDLDTARALRDDSRRVVAALETRVAAESGVALKIRHNAVLGYFVEATARQAEPLFQPPLSALFIHRQTLANQARFTTVELADLDARIARAADQALAMEVAIFERWRAEACEVGPAILTAAEALARLDVAAWKPGRMGGGRKRLPAPRRPFIDVPGDRRASPGRGGGGAPRRGGVHAQ